MIRETNDREAKWVELQNVPASLDDFLDEVLYADPMEIQIPHGHIEVTRVDGDTYSVDRYGNGGGWAWNREWPRFRLKRFILSWTQNPEIKKP
jgi:hypothetical protein